MSVLRYLGIPALVVLVTLTVGQACRSGPGPKPQVRATAQRQLPALKTFATVPLRADLTGLAENERRMVPLLIRAAKHMDAVFWRQAYGDPEALLGSVEDPTLRRYAEVNYGPWDRFANNAPFIDGVGTKPAGANFYPADLTKGEFETHLGEHPEQAEAFKSQYTMVRRSANGLLEAVPYHQYFAQHHRAAADLLRQAAALAEAAGLKRYLELRAQALLNDQYKESDLTWMDMKDNGVDVVIGPIETYEDQLFGYKAAHEAIVLVKDRTWTARLAHYAKLLPDLQKALPVDAAYKSEVPGTSSDLCVYDAIFYAGDSNAGAKTIAINLPNDPDVHQAKGARRLQLKNSMRAKYEEILLPIADVLVEPAQRGLISFGAFFGNTMFHEVAHGLGMRQTVNGNGPVRQALKEQASTLEEGKADILGLFMVKYLFDQGVLTEGSPEEHFVTFMAGIFRSIRFGASSAHGRANILRFNFFKEAGAFSRNAESGLYHTNLERMAQATKELSATILKIQGDGDCEAAKALMTQYGEVGDDLTDDLARLEASGIPTDVVFEQGLAVLGLQ